jgi:hypothetical protein
MRKILSTMLVCAFMVAFTGCGKSAAESAMSDALDKMKEQVSILKGVTDEASAKAAAPKLKAIKDDMAKLSTKTVTAPSADEQAKLMEKYGKEMSEVTAQLTAEMTRIMTNPKLQAALQ